MDAICFDWDGTLVDSLETFYRANAAVMGELGIPFDRDAYRRYYAPDWRLLYTRLGVPEDRLDATQQRWRRSFDPAAVRPFPGAVEALSALSSAGYRLALVTATVRSVVAAQLRAFGVDDLIEVRVFGDELAVHKPDPSPLRLALRRLRLPADRARVAYVGDAPDDMRMARRTGVHGVGIEGLLADRRALLDAGADEVAPSVAAWVASLRLGDGPSGWGPTDREADRAEGGPGRRRGARDANDRARRPSDPR